MAHRKNGGSIKSNLTPEQALEAGAVAIEAAKLASAFHPGARIANSIHDGVTIGAEMNKGNSHQAGAVGIGMAVELLIEKVTKGASGALTAARNELIERSAALQGWFVGKVAESTLDKTQVPCARDVTCR
jgi:hypothetical protein